jgi:hypothetical protein
MRRVPIIIGVTLVLVGVVITRSAVIKQFEQEAPRAGAERPAPIPVADFSGIQNPIVPSPAIDTEAPIFFGAGDGSNGFYVSNNRPGGAD